KGVSPHSRNDTMQIGTRDIAFTGPPLVQDSIDQKPKVDALNNTIRQRFANSVCHSQAVEGNIRTTSEVSMAKTSRERRRQILVKKALNR
ncbi:hypothetical protein Ciccas_010619, partial [Cichlidogyrus casuarinus]